MSRNDPTEVLVAVHYDNPRRHAVLISIDGNNARSKWIARSLLKSFHYLPGQTTAGTDRNGQTVQLPMVHMTIPEWLAQREELI